jgi:kelch-like protein 10
MKSLKKLSNELSIHNSNSNFTLLEKTKVLKEKKFVSEVDLIADNIKSNAKLVSKFKQYNQAPPSFIFDRNSYLNMSKIGFTKKGIKNPKICFFGDRNKILVYEIDKDL